MRHPSGVAHPMGDERIPAGATVGDGGRRFAAMQAAFQQASNAHLDILRESSYTFAGRHVRVRIVGRNLADDFCRPFGHLESREEPSPVPHLTIDLWDEEATGTARPVESTSDDFGAAWNAGAEFISIPPDNRFVCYRFRDSVTWLDRAARQMIGWTASSQHRSLYERGKPLLPLLAVWYHDRDVQLIHAGLVSRGGHGVLLPGGGGAGKSTSALACLDAGFDYLGDDYVGLQVRTNGCFVGHSLYNSTWLEPDHMARFPLLPPHGIHGKNPSEDKALVLLTRVFPKRLARSTPIRVLALPRVAHASATRCRPASKVEALLALSPTSLFALPFRPGARGFQRLSQLVERVPCHWLELGRDLTEIPHRVEELLAEVADS